MSVTGPTCGGMSTRMPSAGSRPVRTSQKLRLVCTPSPSGFGHMIVAGSVLSGGSGGGLEQHDVPACVAAVRVWAPIGAAVAVASSASAVTRMRRARQSLTHASPGGGTIELVVSPRTLMQFEEFHPRALRCRETRRASRS